jgi:hypothetical protein
MSSLKLLYFSQPQNIFRFILENRVYHCQYNDRSKSMMILSPTLEDYLVQLWEHSSL